MPKMKISILFCYQNICVSHGSHIVRSKVRCARLVVFVKRCCFVLICAHQFVSTSLTKLKFCFQPNLEFSLHSYDFEFIVDVNFWPKHSQTVDFEGNFDRRFSN